ncbi:hypothetical protein, partial [Polynucleobacter sp. Latsch14-2]|uniref:hypothetical protein n=1 Tax=Polynucleobacter sp. Latsch14-2 TaxID=2576920 RepID=UPI001C0CA6B7
MVNELNIPKSRNQLIALDYEAKVVNCHPPYSPIRGSLKGEMGSLACPARFERATYALEAVKMIKNNNLHNSISLAKSGVLYAPRI